MRPSARSRPRIQRRLSIAVLASCASMVSAAHVFDLRINLTDSAPAASTEPCTRRESSAMRSWLRACRRRTRSAAPWSRQSRADSEELFERAIAVPGDPAQISAGGVVAQGRRVLDTELCAEDRAGRRSRQPSRRDAGRSERAVNRRPASGGELGQPLLRRHLDRERPGIRPTDLDSAGEVTVPSVPMRKRILRGPHREPHPVVESATTRSRFGRIGRGRRAVARVRCGFVAPQCEPGSVMASSRTADGSSAFRASRRPQPGQQRGTRLAARRARAEPQTRSELGIATGSSG